MERTYQSITLDDLRTHRPRPINLDEFIKFRKKLTLETYPKRGKEYNAEFLSQIDSWIKSHKQCEYFGLDSFPYKDSILGVTHTLDELHFLHKGNIAVYNFEYKYHWRLEQKIKVIEHYTQLQPGDILIVSLPNCFTTNYIQDMYSMLDHCWHNKIAVHIDGAWFGCVRNFELDCSHPAIQTVSISLSKSLAMGNQRIGIRYSREKIKGPISIMNEYGYHNVSDQWIGIKMMEHFSSDFLWNKYSDTYSRVCYDLGLEETDAIHIAKHNDINVGTRLPMRLLIDKKWDNK
tara:strand:+ start:6939 stop:7808 length:870 start_codon:yes stop_codon:yes gene_type:complete